MTGAQRNEKEQGTEDGAKITSVQQVTGSELFVCIFDTKVV